MLNLYSKKEESTMIPGTKERSVGKILIKKLEIRKTTQKAYLIYFAGIISFSLSQWRCMAIDAMNFLAKSFILSSSRAVITPLS